MIKTIKKNKLLYLSSIALLILISCTLIYLLLTTNKQIEDVDYEEPPTKSSLDLPEVPNKDWTTYLNKDYGIVFVHPSEWGKPQEVAQSTRRMLMFDDRLFVVKGTYYDQDKKGYLTLPEYVKKVSNQLTSSNDIEIGEHIGKRVVFKTENNKTDEAVYLAKTENDTELLTITFFHNPDEDGEDDVFDQIVSSLRFTEAKSTSSSNASREKDGCIIAGCDSEVCIDPTKSTGFLPCIYQPVFSCFAQATCGRNEKGGCGWLQTDELKSCIDEKR